MVMLLIRFFFFCLLLLLLFLFLFLFFLLVCIFSFFSIIFRFLLSWCFPNIPFSYSTVISTEYGSEIPGNVRKARCQDSTVWSLGCEQYRCYIYQYGTTSEIFWRTFCKKNISGVTTTRNNTTNPPSLKKLVINIIHGNKSNGPMLLSDLLIVVDNAHCWGKRITASFNN